MLAKILVALDGSAAAEAILPEVRRLLRRVDAEILLVRAENPLMVEALPVRFEEALAQARDYLSTRQRELEAQGVRARSLARIGAPADVLLDVAAEERVSLLALTTHGRSGLGRALQGSVAARLLRSSPVPVLVRRSLEAPPAPEPGPVRRLLVPLDGSDRALQALAAARELAGLFGAEIVLLHVLEPGDPDRAAWDERLGGLRDDLQKDGLSARALVAEGTPAEAILRTSDQEDADLLVLSTHGRSGVPRLLYGSVAEAVLRATPRPLVVVPTREFAGDRVL